MKKQVEYESLREEILSSIQVVKNYRSLLYTIVVASLAYAFDKDEAILFLIPFCAIIPLYLLTMHQIDSTMRVGAYIYVFIEPKTECQWETRLYEYDRLHKSQYSTKSMHITPYWCISFCCLTLSVLKLLRDLQLDLYFYFTVVMQVILLVTCVYIFTFKRVDYLTMKEKYINEWKEIQILENEKIIDYSS